MHDLGQEDRCRVRPLHRSSARACITPISNARRPSLTLRSEGSWGEQNRPMVPLGQAGDHGHQRGASRRGRRPAPPRRRLRGGASTSRGISSAVQDQRRSLPQSCKWLITCRALHRAWFHRPERLVLAVHVQHEAADRRRRIAAVVHQVVPVVVAQLAHIATEGLQQIERMPRATDHAQIQGLAQSHALGADAGFRRSGPRADPRARKVSGRPSPRCCRPRRRRCARNR